MKFNIIFTGLLFCFLFSKAQLVITDEPSAIALAQQLVGQGVSISNVTFTGNSAMAGRFKNTGGLTNINIDSGIVLTTGTAKSIAASFIDGVDGDGITQAQNVEASTILGLPGDATLAAEIDASVSDLNDAAVLEFDFIPSGDSVKFRYVFSSEEYTESFVCEYNDAFGFFLSGPGITGTKNIALIPGTNIPVSILNVNNVDVATGGCQNNIAYYQDNTTNLYFTHDGHTVPLIAASAVQSCTTYHLKVVIADFTDGALDSGVFLEAKSLSSSNPPILDSVSAASTCGGSQLSVIFSQNVLCNTVQNTDFTITGPGGPYTVTNWSSPACSGGAPDAANFILTVNPAIATNGAFQVCLTNVSGSVADHCGNVAPPACLGFTVVTTIPTFNSIAPFCAGSVAPILPTLSTNGITGTWNPSTISNTISGVYTFTPSAGQCAAPVSVTVTVTPGTVPLFTPLQPICTGSAAPILPGVSLNGISGTWSPATVNNTVSGTYTFTPSGSQCAVTATLTETVTAVFTSTTNITICNNQLPYSWNGNSYPTGGIYAVTLTASGGCDSIATLNLTVTGAISSLTTANTCSNELPFSWNGNNYSATGNYSVTLVSSLGCDSIATLNLTVHNISTSSTTNATCNNDLPYSWNGNSYPSAGTYTVTLTSSTGCDSIATLILTVNNVSVSSSVASTCNNELPYSWNGNSYPGAGVYSVTLVNSLGCDSVATLTLSVNNTSTSLTTIAVCDNQLPYTWNGNNYPAAGNYQVTLTGINGCDSIATLHLVLNNIITSLTKDTICSNQLPFSWNGNSYPASGTYSVTLLNAAGCDSVATLILTADSIKSLTTITICSNQLPYSWNSNNYPAAGIYSVMLTSSGGCDSLATLDLTVHNISISTTPITICSNQTPYQWNGNSYSSAGSYPVILTNSVGCDSIATLVLTIHNTSSSTTAVTVCNNQLPYAWNGNTYPAGGSYTVILTNSIGCDSLATLALTVHDTSTSLTEVVICSTELPYSWNGNNYSASGIYPVMFLNSAGCDSVAKLKLTVNLPSASTTPVSVCIYSLPYNWNGNGYSVAGSYSVTLVSSVGCDSVATLILTVNNPSSSTTPLTICSNQLPYTWNGNSYPAAGNYTVTLVNSAGCDSVATLNLTVHSTSGSNSPVTICSDQLPYTWNGQTYATGGIHTVTLVNAAGCDSIATLTLTVHPVTHSTTTASICSANLPYIWNGQSYNTGGSHSVSFINSNGCDSIATLNLTVNPTPATPVASPVIYCQHDITSAVSTTITTPGSHLLWYTSATGGTGSPVAPVPSSSVTGIITYYVSQVNGPCEGLRVPLTVTVNSKPDLGPDHPLQICFGQSANIAALYNTAGYLSSWTSNQLTVTNPASVAIAGQYQLYVQNSFGCADTAIVKLGIQPPVTAHAGPDDNAVYNAPYQLSGSGGVQYQWSPSTFLNNPFIPDPVAVLANDETFILMVKDDIGCMAFDTVKLRVLKGPTFYVPTAFSPNGDGLNDIFRPTAVGIQSMEYFRVFNRYGELIFETSDLSKGWDGTFKGKKQDAGNYVWAVKGTDRTGLAKGLRGNVMLIR